MEQLIEISHQVYAFGPLAVAAVGAGISMLGGLFGANRAKKQAEAMEEAQRSSEAKIRALEAGRQQIIDPYANIKDLSSMISNPFANLQVATKAAEMQSEESDLALATTLDTLRATGAGSGGATALAQAATRSKAGVAATIEQQEAQNARLRAQGEQQAQARRMAEAQRIQGARAQGAAFQFGIREQRQQTALDRESALQSQYMGLAQQSRSAQSAALGSVFGALGGALIGSAGAIGGGGGFKTAAASGFTGTRKQFRLFQNTGIGKNLFAAGTV
jgi:hypothetical protein|tara:strand:+ start:451 stop:1275 length:825 start_codon:yes stop_codon:yes gene_type:complete